MIKAVFFDIGGTVHTQDATPESDRDYIRRLWCFLHMNHIYTAETPEQLLEHINAGAKAYKSYTEQELIELPAGKIELGEDPKTCGIRELEEECGCTADHFEKLTELYPTPAYCTEIIHIYYAQGLHETKQHLDEGEFLTVMRVPFSQAVQMVLSGEIKDAKTQIGILNLWARRNQKTTTM